MKIFKRKSINCAWIMLYLNAKNIETFILNEVNKLYWIFRFKNKI